MSGEVEKRRKRAFSPVSFLPVFLFRLLLPSLPLIPYKSMFRGMLVCLFFLLVLLLPADQNDFALCRIHFAGKVGEEARRGKKSKNEKKKRREETSPVRQKAMPNWLYRDL